MIRKKLGCLIGKLHSIHIAVSGAIAFFYYLQQDLRLSTDQPNTRISRQFHDNITLWCAIIYRMESQPSSLAELVHQEASGIGYIGASGHSAGGVWIEPNGDRYNYL